METLLTAKMARNIVINNSPPQKVPQEVFDKIEAAAKDRQFSIQYNVGVNKLEAVHWQNQLTVIGYQVTLTTIELGGEGSDQHSLYIKW